MIRPSSLRKMQQSITDPKYEGVRTSRQKLMESEEEDSSGDDAQDDEESHDDDDDDDDEDESEERRVWFENMPSDNQPWNSNGVISDDDMIPSASKDGSEESEEAIASNRNAPSKQPSENVTEDLSSTLKNKREEDLEKGQAVKRQAVRPLYSLRFCQRNTTSIYRPYGTRYSTPEYVFKNLSYLLTDFRQLVLPSNSIVCIKKHFIFFSLHK